MMANARLRIRNKQLRFASVGAINTIIDLTIYGLLRQVIGFFLANLVSTSAGMIIGYLLHRNYTFQSTQKRTKKEALLFFGLTIFGLWVIQPVIIYFTTHPIVVVTGTLPHNLQLLFPKCLAILVGLIWNYLCYNYIVFKNKQPDESS